MSRFKRIDSIVEAVGNTPLVRLRSIERDNPGVKIYLKLEYLNPGGSVKDRPALNMMRDAIADGRLTKDRVLVDATSGNTGVAYSLFGACLGYKVALVTDGRMSGASGKTPAAIHVTPEAAKGGPLAYVQDGAVISVNAETG